MEYLIIFLMLCMSSSVMGATSIYNVMSYGAVGDGRRDDSQAFKNAWSAACGQTRSKTTPVIYIPPRRTFYLSPLTFQGPCKSPRIYVLVSGNVVAPMKNAWGQKQVNAWVIFYNVNGLVIKGRGTFDGRGSSWWPVGPCYQDRANGVICKGPNGLQFRRCNGLRLDGFAKVNGPGSNIIIMSTDDAVVSNLRVISPGNSPNTDGIDVSGSTRVKILNSFIGTGDDCIAITGGCSDISVSGITCGPGHGISIGSLGEGGNVEVVENVRVRNCTLRKTLTGVRIKTYQGGQGRARGITFEGIKFDAVDNPIQIEQFYCPLKVNCKISTSAVAISDVTFRSILGTSVAENVINLNCSKSVACRNIVLDRVYISPSTSGRRVYASCSNAYGRATHTKPAVKCLRK